MICQAAIERQGKALQRILVALAAIAGLLERARFDLPQDIHRALLGPLREAEAAAARLPLADPKIQAARLKLRFLALCRAIDGLRRRALRADSGLMRERAGKLRQPRVNPLSSAPRATAHADTS